MVLGWERKQRRWRCSLRRLKGGQSCYRVVKGDGETNVIRIVLSILESVSHFQLDLFENRDGDLGW